MPESKLSENGLMKEDVEPEASEQPPDSRSADEYTHSRSPLSYDANMREEQEDNYLVDDQGQQIRIERKNVKWVDHLDISSDSDKSVNLQRLPADSDKQVPETSDKGFESSSSNVNDSIYEEEKVKMQIVAQLQ